MVQGTITFSLDLNGTEYIDPAKYNIEKCEIGETTVFSPIQTPESIRQLNILHPITSITLYGAYYDITDMDLLYEAIKDTNIRDPSNNTFEIREDGVAAISESVAIADMRVQFDIKESEKRWVVVLTLHVQEGI